MIKNSYLLNKNRGLIVFKKKKLNEIIINRDIII